MGSDWRYSSYTRASPDHPEECQDSAVASARDDGAILLVVADGASSSLSAGEAASYATSSARDTFTRWEWPSSGFAEIRLSFQEYLDRLGEDYEAWVATRPLKADAYNTTLALGVILGPWLLLANIGDGFIAVSLGSDSDLLVPMPPDRPAVQGGSYMLADWRDRRNELTIFAPNLARVLVSTDGLGLLLRFPVVDRGDGTSRSTLVGLQPRLVDVVDRYALGETSLEESALVSPQFSLQNDDVGVAIAAR